MNAVPSPLPASWLRRLAAVGVAAVLTGASVAAADPSAAPASGEAVRVIERLHAALLGAMKEAASLGFAGRRDRLTPALAAVYDFPFMAEKSVGRGWQQLDSAVREKVVNAFARLAVATYAGRFKGWSGERFETLGTQPATHGTLLVRTRLVRSNGEPVALDYRLRPTDAGEWRIIDVFLNGTVSELALRRAEYSAVLKRQGHEKLLSALEEKIAAQERGEPDAAAP